MMPRLSQSAVALVLLASIPGSGVAQMAPELVQKGKRATALVEIRVDGGVGYGSAFCIDKSGLFVTNAHVVEGAVEAGQVKLVLHPGEKEQRVATARVVRSSDDLDLAILKIDADTALTALELGKDDELVETTPATAFGFPFGKAMPRARDGYPTVSVNSSRITSLKKADGKLALVQIDGLMNPGNSGGPLLDPSGKVIGVVAAGVLGAGINFAIAVGRLSEYIASPLITFDPPAIAYGDRSRSANWTIEVASAAPGARLPADLAVSVTVEGGSATPRRSIARALGGGKYKVTVVPVPRNPERRVSLNISIGGRFLQGTVADRDLKVNGKTVALGDLRQLFSGTPPRAILADGRSASGPILGLGKVRLHLQAGGEATVDLAEATSIMVNSVGQAPAIAAIEVSIEAKQGAKVLGALRKSVPLRGAEQVAIARRAEPPRGVVAVLQPMQGQNSAEGLVDIGGVLDAPEGGARVCRGDPAADGCHRGGANRPGEGIGAGGRGPPVRGEWQRDLGCGHLTRRDSRRHDESRRHGAALGCDDRARAATLHRPHRPRQGGGVHPGRSSRPLGRR